MADFKIAYTLTAVSEGGYSNHKDDTGGETWKGVARNKWPKWIGWGIVDYCKKQVGFPVNLRNRNDLQAAVLDFYKKEFWDVLRLDTIKNQLVANELYDTAVNCGTGVAARFLQRALNVLNQSGKYYPDATVDGVIGPKTIVAANTHPNPSNIFKALNCLQGAYYIQLAEQRESQEAFTNGWFDKRVA